MNPNRYVIVIHERNPVPTGKYISGLEEALNYMLGFAAHLSPSTGQNLNRYPISIYG
ncbi:hypothetical protein ACN083_07010 [Rothia sp. CCM 9418]|uniref:hypothetical protein n=1 Tax=Rothia sp. CCM 9418 TaxID=3402661 RepID=UPI003AEBED5F